MIKIHCISVKNILFKIPSSSLYALMIWAMLTIKPTYAAEKTSNGINEAAYPSLLQTEVTDPESKLPFLFAAYFVTWLVFFAYAYFISRKQSELSRKIKNLEKILSEK